MLGVTTHPRSCKRDHADSDRERPTPTPTSTSAPQPPHWFPAGAAGMTAETFRRAFAPQGAIALHELQVAPADADTVVCRARLTVGRRALDLETRAPGTIGAMSEILYGLGAGVEIVSLYQQPDGAHVAAYLLCERDGRRCWSYGRAATGDEATVRALISAANQLDC